MIHLVHMIQRRFPDHAHAVVAALVVASMLLVMAGLWMLLQ